MNHVLTAIDIVSNWNLPEDRLADAISAQVMHLAGINLDDLVEVDDEVH